MTYYDVLNINKNASDKEIKNAYRALAKKYHPDTYKGNKNIAEEKMKEINEAYDLLSNTTLKTKYDEQFNQNKIQVQHETSYTRTYHNNYENDYKSPDPRDADYRNYYNYSPYYEEEPEYDFSKLKVLFEGTRLKVVFVFIGVIVVLSTLLFILNQIKLEASKVLDTVSQPLQTEEEKEVVPENNYMSELPNYFNQEKFEQELDEQLKEIEAQYNQWYENEGKQYEEQIKQELNSLYENIKNQSSMNY